MSFLIFEPLYSMTFIVIPLGIAGIGGECSGDSATVAVGARVGGQEARGLSGIQAAFYGHLVVADGSVAGEVWAVDRQGIGGEGEACSAGIQNICGDGHGSGADGSRSSAFVVAGDREVVTAVLRPGASAILAAGPAHRAATGATGWSRASRRPAGAAIIPAAGRGGTRICVRSNCQQCGKQDNRDGT
jgi:hypothetical protein